MPENNQYTTPDTALASYLISEGYPAPDIELIPNNRFPDGYKAVFSFDDDPKIQHYAHLWAVGEAQGNLCVFHSINRRLVKRVKTKIHLAKM